MTNSTNKKTTGLKKTAVQMTAVFVIFLLWLALYLIINHPMLLPSPWAVFKAFLQIFSQYASVKIILMSLLRLIGALFGSMVLGISLGFIASQKPVVERFFRPIVTILRTIPVISILVILMILLGIHTTPYLITFLMIFPLMYQATVDSIHQIDPAYLDIYHLDDNRWISGLKHCYLPLIRSQLTTAFLQSAGLGIKVLAMAEYFSQTPNSIGNALYFARVNLEYDTVFAWTFVLIVFAIALEMIVRHQQKKAEPD